MIRAGTRAVCAAPNVRMPECMWGTHCGKLLPQNDRHRKVDRYTKYYFYIQSVELFRDGHSVCAKPPICFSALMRITTTPPHEDSGMATRLEPGIVQARRLVGKRHFSNLCRLSWCISGETSYHLLMQL
jgi:hypothetical protein